LDAQRAAIEAACEQRGWTLVGIEQDVASGKSTNGRHGLERAIAECETGDAAALVVAKLDRLSRSLLDFAELMQRSQRKRWALVALDLGVDTSTPSGEMMANVLAVFAQFERRLIGQRTREALAAKRAAGVRLGRPRTLPDEVRRQIIHARSRGETFRAIAERLNTEGVATGQGGARWYAATVRTVALAEVHRG
jgi:DNA invertase Pin-like site-specific DNA recombinase